MSHEPPRDDELLSTLSHSEVEAVNTLVQLGTREDDQDSAVEIDSEEVDTSSQESVIESDSEEFDTSSQESAIELGSEEFDTSEMEIDSEDTDLSETEIDSGDVSEGSGEDSELDVDEECTSEEWQNYFFGYRNANKSTGTDAEEVLAQEAHYEDEVDTCHVMQFIQSPSMLCNLWHHSD